MFQRSEARALVSDMIHPDCRSLFRTNSIKERSEGSEGRNGKEVKGGHNRNQNTLYPLPHDPFVSYRSALLAGWKLDRNISPNDLFPSDPILLAKAVFGIEIETSGRRQRTMTRDICWLPPTSPTPQ